MRFVILAFIFAFMVAVFAVQNSLPVTISLFRWSFSLSLVIIILGSATFGALTVLSLALVVQYRMKQSFKQLLHRQGELEAENTILQKRLEQEQLREH